MKLFILAPLLLLAAARPDTLHLSAFRLRSLRRPFDWFAKYQQSARPLYGTAIAISAPEVGLALRGGGAGPTFLTTASNVANAESVHLSLPALGERQWDAEVAMVCHHFDLALLRLTESEAFANALSTGGIKLQPLTLALPGPAAKLGTQALLLGYGAESALPALQVVPSILGGARTAGEAGGLCMQHGASSGKTGSGWALVSQERKELLGLHLFDCASPAWRIRSFLHSAASRLKAPPIVPKPSDSLLRVPSVGLTSVTSNDAVYQMMGSNGCPSQGVLITHIAGNSVFRSAKPPLSAPFLLQEISGVALDASGLGRPSSILGPNGDEPVPFDELLWIREDFSGDIQVVACEKGSKPQKHDVSLAWNTAYGVGVRWIDDPFMEGVETERFGDVALMRMTQNHVIDKVDHVAMVARWLHPDFVDTSRVVVSWVRPQSYAYRSGIIAGACVSELNGHEVHDLDDVRKYFVPDGLAKRKPSTLKQWGNKTRKVKDADGENVVWSIRTDLGYVYTEFFLRLLREQLAGPSDQITPAVSDAAKRLSQHLKPDHALSS